MVAFGRFQVKCFQRKVFLYVGSVCLREVMSRSYTSQDIMSGFMSVNLKNKGSLFEVSEGFIKKQISHLLKSERRTIFCFVTKSVALRPTEIMFVCLFVVGVSCCCRCCRNLPQNEETREKMADHIWHHDNACEKAYILSLLSYIQKSKVDLPLVFLDANSTPCHQKMKILT